jgi:hypothetical protein
MKLKCGIPIKDWKKAKREVRKVLIRRAKARGIISYPNLTRKLTAIQLDPHSFALRTLLQEITAEEDAAGRGMLSALVVYRSGDRQPGPGFFDLAQRLGKDTPDILSCWITELKLVYAYWSGGGEGSISKWVRENFRKIPS